MAETRLSRRRLLTGTLGLATLSLLAACGTAPTTPTASSAASTAPAPSAAASTVASTAASAAPSAAPSATALATRPAATPSSGAGAATPGAATSGPRTIATAMGQVTVPASPQRIVCLDSYSVSDLLDSGLTPIGIPEKMSGAVVPAHTTLVPPITTLGAYGEPDLEKVASLKPDLIMAITIDKIKANYDRLSAIAPTTLFDYTVPDAWRVLAGQFMEAAGRSDKLAGFQTTYQERATALRAKYAPVLGRYRWAFIMGRGDTWQLYTPNSGGGKIMVDVGLQFTGAVNGLSESAKSYSLEQINLIADADAIVTYAGRDGMPLATHAKLAELPTWQALNAVKNKRLFYMTDIITFSYNSALLLFDEIEAALKQLPAS